MITALLIASRNVIRSATGYAESDVLVQNDGQPPPTVGNQFIAVHGTSWKPNIVDQNQGIDEVADLTVTITARMQAIPYDIRGQEIYIRKSLELENVAQIVKINLHQNYTLIASANALLTGVDKIVEPLRWLGGDAQPKYASNRWFSSEDDNEYAGLILTLQFGRARRMQTLTNIR